MEYTGLGNFLLYLGIYLIPTIIAMVRGHKDHNAISMMNFILGWTVIFWLWAFFWSLTGNIKEAKSAT